MSQNTLRKVRFFLFELFVVVSVLFVCSQLTQMASPRDVLSSQPELGTTDTTSKTNLKTKFSLWNFLPADFGQLKINANISNANESRPENQLVFGGNDFSPSTFSLWNQFNCANCMSSIYQTNRNVSSAGASEVFPAKPPYLRKAFPNYLIDFGSLPSVDNLFGGNALTAAFPGVGVGAIPDATASGPQVPGTPLDITFNVTGISGAPTNVEVNMTGTHSYVGDLKATLIAPNGTSLTVFGYTGATSTTSFGSASDISGTYNFKDSAAGTNWWTAAAATAIPVGDYRTTVSGPTTDPAAVTNLTAAFSGVASSNGTWTLRLTDGAGADTGSITAANLILSGAPPVAPANDNFVNAFPLLEYPHFNGGYWSGTEGEVSGSNTGATLESGEPIHAGVPGGKSVWFKLRAEEYFSTYVFTTNGSDFDTTFAIYTGTNLNDLTLVASNDDLAPFQTSSVVFQALAGTVYYIAIDGKQGASGNFKLAWATKGTGGNSYGILTDEFNNSFPSGVNLAQTTINMDCSTGRYTATTIAPSNTYFNLPAFPDNALNCRLAGRTEVFPLSVYNGSDARIPFPQTPTYQITGTINAGSAADTRVIIGGFGKQRDCAVSQITGGGVNYTCSGVGRYSSPTIWVTNPTLRYTPSIREYSNVQSNFSSQNFTAAASTYFDIRGRVVNTSGQPVGGMPVGLTGTETSTANTYSDGSYYHSVSPNGNYTITPSNNYDSVPLNYVFNSINRDQLEKNFTVALKNDSFANAINITGVTNPILGSVSGATWETDEPNHADQPPRRSIWYRWTAPSNSSFTFSTADSNFDTVIGVYTGTDVGSLTQIAAGDDVNNNDRTSRATFFATAGTVYSIAIDAKDFYFGEYERDVTLRILQNSTISGRIMNVNGRTLNINVNLVVYCTGGFSNSFNVSGNYSFSVPQGSGNCTLTPSGGGVALWSPFDRTVDSSQDQTGIDFTPQTPSYNVVGTLNNLPNTNNVAVSVSLAGSNPRSCSFNSANGVYQCVSLTIYGDYTITPSQTGSIFDPATRDYLYITSSFTSQNFNATPANNPVPSITTLSPASVTAGISPFDLIINGSGFVNGSIVRWNGQDRTPIFVSALQLKLQLTAQDLQTAGIIPITVFNPMPGGGPSNALNFTINNPAPSIMTLSPSSLAAGSPGFELTVNGNGFVNGSIIRWNGQDRIPTTFVSATQIKAQIPATDIQTVGQFPVNVFNPTPGGGNSAAINFSVTTNTILILVQANPVGRSFTVDGTVYTSNQQFNWTSDSSHTIATTSPQAGAAGTQYVWSSWNIGGAISQTVAPTTATTYSANFTTQHQLTMTAGTGGTVTPSSGNWYDAGQSVPISATPNSGFVFAGWSGTGTGSYPGTNNPANVLMNSPITQTANFTGCVFSITPPTSQAFGANGGTGSFSLNTSAGCAWTATTNSPSWINITGASSGTTSGMISFSVAANPGGVRTGTITAGGQVFTVNQSAVSSLQRAAFDFDGDLKTDIGIFRPNVGQWWIQHSSTLVTKVGTFGVSTDKLVPADYTGDGKTDIAVYHPATSEWDILRSENNTYYGFPFGSVGDTAIPADYDGDGKADVAVFNNFNATWWILRSSLGIMVRQFGTPGDATVPGDYDGDGKTDIAIYRPGPGQWWINRSSDNVTIVRTFGVSTDKTVQGDYTGDGKADVAFWRPSTGAWFILRSEDFSFYSFPFGTSTDIPVPGDYDGDGKIDPGVYRPSNSTWYVLQSQAGTLIRGFGITNDIPIPSAFIR